jgi:phosphomannomutase
MCNCATICGGLSNVKGMAWMQGSLRLDVKFGTSGLRGLAADLANGPAFAHVHAFCRMLVDERGLAPGTLVAVGRDRRQSSPLIAAQAMAAIRTAGLEALDCGEVPTPALAHHAFSMGSPAVMVTGSHIPADRNGLKFYLPGAEVGKSEELRIAALAEGAPPLPSGIAPGTGYGAKEAVMERWRARHADLLPSGAFAGLSIGIHEHSSVATGFLGELLESLGARIRRFGHSSVFVPVDTEAVEPEVITLYREEARAGIDAIISTDADGDRPLLADETGTPLPGDLIASLAARFVVATFVATPVSSNSALDDTAGIEVIRTRIGSPYVIAAMEAATTTGNGTVVGFEANGGFLLASPVHVGSASLSPLPTRDSTLPILATLWRMREGRISASGLAAAEGFRATASGRLKDYAVERAASLMKRLADDPAFEASFLGRFGKVISCDTTDGRRYRLSGGRIIHFRPSGNAPEMRCYAEASDTAAAALLLADGLACLDGWKG